MSRIPTLEEFWERGQRGWPATYPIAQLPNAPLLIALTAWPVARCSGGARHAAARGTFLAALTAWGWAETAHGANSFRRALGVGSLAYVVADVAEGSSRRLVRGRLGR